MGSAKAGYECIKAFSETDFTEDLKAIEVPVLVIHSEDDQIVPYADSAPLTVKLLRNGTLKTYKDLPARAVPDPSRDRSIADLLAFIRGEPVGLAETQIAEPSQPARPDRSMALGFIARCVSRGHDRAIAPPGNRTEINSPFREPAARRCSRG